MASKSSPLTIVAAFAAVTIAGGGLLFAQHLARPANQTKSVAANRPQPRDLGPPSPGPRTGVASSDSDTPSAKTLRQSVVAAEPSVESNAPKSAYDEPAQTERVRAAQAQAERGTSPFAGATETPVETSAPTPAPAEVAVDTNPAAPTPRPSVGPWPWDYSAAPIFVPVETGNPLGTPGTSTVGTAGTSTLGTSGTRTLGTAGTSTLGTAGTSTVGTNTTRAIVPPSR